MTNIPYHNGAYKPTAYYLYITDDAHILYEDRGRTRELKRFKPTIGRQKPLEYCARHDKSMVEVWTPEGKKDA